MRGVETVSTITTKIPQALSLDVSRLLRYGAILAQLGVILVVMRQFGIENAAFREVAALAFAGFAIHYFLPQTYRLTFFAALSVGALFLIFGLANGAWMLAFGLVLLGICHLPLNLWVRVVLLLAVGVLAGVAKLQWISGPWSQAIWPILASMFMFRLVVYLYDMQHEETSFARAISYFFMLPNVCFPMFPVVDYRGFRRNYYDAEEHQIYQTGVDWMVRGIIQLILYRVIYYYWTIPPSEVVDPDSMTQYLVSNFLLYLRISGDFHLITGMLHLFGFNLIPTHHLYCLSSSFTDFWRRINIYWKDFMMKVFYYPLFFKLRKYGDVPAIVVATMIVFILTWLLHSYQWFWLRGEFPITWQDGIFWMTLAFLVVVSSLREFKRGRQRTLGSTQETVQQSIVRGLRTVFLFFTICVLWSIWTSESIVSWVGMWRFAWDGIPSNGSAMPTLFVAIAMVIFFAAILFGRESSIEKKIHFNNGRSLNRSTLETLVILAIIAPIGLPQVYSHFGANVANIVISLKSGNLNRADAAALERGYYEGLTRVNRFNSQLWEIYMNRPSGGLLDVSGFGMTRLRDDFLQTELPANFRSETKFGQMTTNRWGMRDRDYPLKPTRGTVRGVVLGYSTIMGWGVGNDETFENLVENRINAHFPENSDVSFELLNRAVPGYRPPQQVMALDESLKFEPHIVFYMAAGREQWNTINFLADILTKGVDIPYAGLKALTKDAGVEAGMDRPAIVRRLKQHEEILLSWIYRYIGSRSIAENIHPVWIYLPPVFETTGEPEERSSAFRLAKEAGFEIIDLSRVYEGADPQSLSLEEWDKHPNAKAHERIAAAIFKSIRARPEVYKLPPLQ
jgi:hypothetical protein